MRRDESRRCKVGMARFSVFTSVSLTTRKVSVNHYINQPRQPSKCHCWLSSVGGLSSLINIFSTVFTRVTVMMQVMADLLIVLLYYYDGEPLQSITFEEFAEDTIPKVFGNVVSSRHVGQSL